MSEASCTRWTSAPHITDEVPFSVVCKSVSDALYIDEVRNERENMTAHQYTDENGRKMIHIPVGEF